MRLFLLISLFFIPFFFSCSKEEPLKPNPAPAAGDSTRAVVFSAFNGQRSDDAVTLQFITSRQKDVKYFEVYSGTDSHQLCAIGRLSPGASDGHTTNLYIFVDKHPKGDPIYYMIGYVTDDGSLNFNDKMLEISSKTDN